MKFAMIGGDRRSVLLASALASDGHRVRCFALDKAEFTQSVVSTGCIQGAVYGADVVVLPIPAEKNGTLNAAYSSQSVAMDDVISSLWAGQIIVGGAFSARLHRLAEASGFTDVDLLKRESFAIGNAFLTAEGAAECLSSLSERAIWGSQVLITGWGRVGRALALRLKGMGADITVAARNSADRAEAQMLGCMAVDYCVLPAVAFYYDFIVNTVPARVIGEDVLESITPGTVLLELASAPGGFDPAEAERRSICAASAPGLPGRYAPLSAAMLMKGEIYDIVSELEMGG